LKEDQAMANPIITITGCTPDQYSVRTNRGGAVVFKSGDGKVYFIDFGNNDPTISSQSFPIEVPARGSAPLNVKNSTPAGSYAFRIVDAATLKQCCPQVDAGPGEEPPVLIVD
jgi:hypothetical protein